MSMEIDAAEENVRSCECAFCLGSTAAVDFVCVAIKLEVVTQIWVGAGAVVNNESGYGRRW